MRGCSLFGYVYTLSVINFITYGGYYLPKPGCPLIVILMYCLYIHKVYIYIAARHKWQMWLVAWCEFLPALWLCMWLYNWIKAKVTCCPGLVTVSLRDCFLCKEKTVSQDLIFVLVFGDPGLWILKLGLRTFHLTCLWVCISPCGTSHSVFLALVSLYHCGLSL